VTEAELQRMVTDLARWSGFLVWHDNDSRRNTAGWPDLVLVHTRTGRLLFVELKSQAGKVRPAQHVWLRVLGIKHETYVWKPQDWLSGSIRAVLAPEQLAA
jgi:hypothetical protein